MGGGVGRATIVGWFKEAPEVQVRSNREKAPFFLAVCLGNFDLKMYYNAVCAVPSVCASTSADCAAQ